MAGPVRMCIQRVSYVHLKLGGEQEVLVAVSGNVLVGQVVHDDGAETTRGLVEFVEGAPVGHGVRVHTKQLLQRTTASATPVQE